MPKNAARFLFAAVLLAAGAAGAAPPMVMAPVATPTVSGDFAGEEGAISTNLSGIACRPAAAGARFCVFVDDQVTFVQPAILRGDVLTVVKPVAVAPDKEPPGIIGKEPPPPHCPKTDGFKDLDGEAVALAPSRLYVMGSHGCGRNSEKYRPSSFILARLKIDASNKFGAIQRTYRLSEVLRTQPVLAPYFAQALMTKNGLTLEGMAVRGSDLLFGLRAPSLAGKAFILSVPADALFSAKQPLAGKLIEIALGENLGVRDLAVLPDDKILVLAGPAQDQAAPYSVVLLDAAGVEIKRAALAAAPAAERAEGMAVLDQSADSLRLLVVFDGAKNGGPREYLFPLK